MSRLKVLWFSNTPANSDEYLGSTLKSTGGWLKALDIHLQEHVDLAIVFYGKNKDCFKHKQTRYFSIKKKNNLLQRLYYEISSKPRFSDDLSVYLQIVSEFQPDIIHIHGTENEFGCLIEAVKIPVVLSIQGNLTVYNHKYYSGFPYFSFIKYMLLEVSLNSLLEWYSYLVNFSRFRKEAKRELYALHGLKYVIGRTDWDFRITRVLSPNSCYFKVDELLRSSFYNLKKINYNFEVPVLFTTTGKNPYKGFLFLCRSLKLLQDVGFSGEWHVAGITEEDYIVRITKRYLGEHYPKTGLILHGALTEQEIAHKLLSSTIYIMPSHIENSPNSLCEAMLVGVPCISTTVGGVQSLIKNYHNGVLVQDGDPWAMSGAILELIRDKSLIERLGTNARITALSRHAYSNVIEQLLLAYRTVLEMEKE